MKRGQERAYELLRQRLVGGHYVPGTHLREEPLAQEFGLSRSPIRAALQRLVKDGLATADAGQGIHVAAWSDHDVEEIFQLRMQLEPLAAQLACERGGDPLVARLALFNAEMGAAIERDDDAAVEAIQEANRGFHLALLEYSGSPRLREFLETMIDMPIIVRSFHLSTRTERLQSLNHHLDITRAAELRDGEIGLHAMKLHLRMSYSRFMQHRSHWRAGSGGAGSGEPR
jgi:DNA-binding GntR family transcriptional regulator